MKHGVYCTSPGDSQTSCKVWRPPVNDVAAVTKARRETSIRLKFAGVPQTPEPISAASGPKFAILCGHVEQILLFNMCDTCLSCEDIARQSVLWRPDGDFFGDFFASCISVTSVQHISDLHSKFALRPYHMWKYGRHPICDG